MAVQDMMKNITEPLAEAADVNKVFGEPRIVGRKTIIPIATVGMGFGAGGGKGKGKAHGSGDAETPEGEGGGGGGGGSTRPLAILEVTDEETKLLPVVDLTRVIVSGMVFAGAMTWMITKLMARQRKQRSRERG